MTDLQDHLTSTIDEPPPGSPEREAWQIGGDREAAWAIRKMAGYQAEVDRIQGIADEETARIREWAADSTSGARSQVEWFEGQLLGYLHRLLDENPELPKTYRLPGADLCRRKRPDRVELVDACGIASDSDDDRAALVRWCLDNDRLDLLTIKPSISALKSLVGITVAAPDLTVDDKGKPSVMGERSHLVDQATGEIIPAVEYVVGDESFTVSVKKGGAS